MQQSADPTRQTPARPRVTRRGAIAASLLAWVLLFVALPLRLGRHGPRIGWRDGRPGPLNLLSVIPMGLGATGLTWCMLEHYPRGETIAVSLVPETLLGSGPYRFSRNPMYVSELSLWFGCSLFNGSPLALGAGAAFAGGMRYAIGREEKTLADQFGAAWSDYTERVRRWL